MCRWRVSTGLRPRCSGSLTWRRNPKQVRTMNKTHLYAMLLLPCAAVLFAAANPASVTSGPWRSLLEDHSAPAWRGWKEPGLPAGWHVAGGALSKEGPVDDLVTTQSL